MSGRRKEQKERDWKEANKGQWSLLQPCSQQPHESLFSPRKQPALCVLSTGGLSFPGLLSHGCASQPVLPTQTDICASLQWVSRVEGAVVQRSMGHTESSRWGARSVDRLSDGWTYYLDTEETPRRWPGFPCTQMYLDLLEGTSTLQRISFHVPHTTHSPYLLPKLWWTSHVMRQGNGGGLKQVWGSRNFKECWRHWRLPWKHLIPFRWEAPTCVTPELWITHKRLDSACLTVSLAVEKGLSLWFSLRNTLSA